MLEELETKIASLCDCSVANCHDGVIPDVSNDLVLDKHLQSLKGLKFG